MSAGGVVGDEKGQEGCGGNERQTPVLGGALKLYLKRNFFCINRRKWDVKKKRKFERKAEGE
jgi:hypothetical protein